MFRTELSVPPSERKINLKNQVFSIGSCFAVHIGEQLQKFKFQTLTNPFGTIFNPISIFDLIEISLKDRSFPGWTFVENQGVHRNYLLHSAISSPNKDQFMKMVESRKKEVSDFLKRTDVILLTFGTAIVYELKTNQQVVANCHKVPANQFEKQFLSVDEIVQGFGEIYSKLTSLNKNLRFILTVSPVRHLKETLQLNGVSKSILRVAAHQLQEEFDNVEYFPSYELIMDDLRDYRFFKEDMLHPNDQAIQYVWDKFSQAYFDEETMGFLKEWEKIINALDHKPFYPGSVEHQKFIAITLGKINKFKNTIDVSYEIERLNQQLDD